MGTIERTVYKAVLSFLDAENHKSTMTVPYICDIGVGDKIGAGHAIAQRIMSEIYKTTPSQDASLPLMGDLSGCYCTGYHISAVAVEDTARSGAWADVEDKSMILLKTETGHSTQVSIPGEYNELQIESQGLLTTDLDRSQFSALFGVLLNGIDMTIGLGGWVYPTDARGSRLIQVEQAYKTQTGSQKSNKRRG